MNSLSTRIRCRAAASFAGCSRKSGQPYRTELLEYLEAAVSRGEYLVGDGFTAAGVYVGSHIGFGMQFGTIEKRPAFERYWRRLSARPAALRAQQIDDALAAQQQEQSAS